jgi:hypothetical protein
MVGSHAGLDADNWRIDPDVLAAPFEIPILNAKQGLAPFLAGSITLVVVGVRTSPGLSLKRGS